VYHKLNNKDSFYSTQRTIAVLNRDSVYCSVGNNVVGIEMGSEILLNFRRTEKGGLRIECHCT
jgi:hypothetical protein